MPAAWQTFQRKRLQPPPPVASSFPRAPRAISRRPRGLAARAVSKPQRRRPPAIGISVGTTRRQPRCVCLARLAMMAALHGPYPRQYAAVHAVRCRGSKYTAYNPHNRKTFDFGQPDNWTQWDATDLLKYFFMYFFSGFRPSILDFHRIGRYRMLPTCNTF